LSVDEFATSLAEHLNKRRKEKEIGKKIETRFVSMSPVLESTIHTVGQKWKEKGQGEAVGLAIFDVRKLQQNPGTAIFRVTDILKFLKMKVKALSSNETSNNGHGIATSTYQ